mmetsp:Transcript_128314/g.369520  ORF Transcript_128314/g.369520 Transcript_128314/m.369520 type:complete len:201 (+) Transcript_128314:411-1013(+)
MASQIERSVSADITGYEETSSTLEAAPKDRRTLQLTVCVIASLGPDEGRVDSLLVRMNSPSLEPDLPKFWKLTFAFSTAFRALACTPVLRRSLTGWSMRQDLSCEMRAMDSFNIAVRDIADSSSSSALLLQLDMCCLISSVVVTNTGGCWDIGKSKLCNTWLNLSRIFCSGRSFGSSPKGSSISTAMKWIDQKRMTMTKV